MKKSTILTLATAGMIVTTTVATYALWDTVSIESKSNTVTLRNPVTIEDKTAEQTINADAATLNPGSITAAGTVTFNIQNEDSLATSLQLQESVTAAEALSENTDYTIKFTGTGVSGKTDNSVTHGEETYNYTMTFTESGLSKLAANGNQCTVKVTATLQ